MQIVKGFAESYSNKNAPNSMNLKSCTGLLGVHYSAPTSKRQMVKGIWSVPCKKFFCVLMMTMALAETSLYSRSGVSCNRFGHLGWNQFFNLLKYSLL